MEKNYSIYSLAILKKIIYFTYLASLNKNSHFTFSAILKTNHSFYVFGQFGKKSFNLLLGHFKDSKIPLNTRNRKTIEEAVILDTFETLQKVFDFIFRS